MAETYDGAIDKGLEGVVACNTSISSIVDATLTYRGYTIEDLAAKSSFEEVIYLLWHNELPNAQQLADLRSGLGKHYKLSDSLLQTLKTLPNKDLHPMAWLRTAVSAMALEDASADDISENSLWDKANRLTAKMGTLVATFERLRNGQDLVEANPEKGIAWNFLYQLKGTEPDAEAVKVMDTCLILHADHELNCSAFSARVTTSSLSDMYSSIVSAIGTLKGPLHGGANEQVMRMLKKIGSVDGAKDWIAEALKNKEKVMGFGHRVYKNGDPRAKILRTMSESMSKKSGEAHWYEMSKVIDDTVQGEKGLLPNVDFYSATVYYSMGIPLDLYTPIFAVSRVTGWLAHIIEQYSNNRIYRPRGNYTGNTRLTYTDIGSR